MYQDKPLDISAEADSLNLRRTVIEASSDSIRFIDEKSGEIYVYQIEGDFEDNAPTHTNEIKGNIVKITVYSGDTVVTSYTFAANDTLNAEELMTTWQGFDVDENNFFKSDAQNAQNDTVFAGQGSDHVEVGAGDDFVVTDHGNDTVLGGEGDDTIYDAWGTDSLSGGEGDDFIRAFSGQNRFSGGAGNDTLIGGRNHDTLEGCEGNDVLIGDYMRMFGLGRDHLKGGKGNDLLEGGVGGDIFMFSSNDGSDVIGDIEMINGTYAVVGNDFNYREDKILLNNEFGFSSKQAVLDSFENINGDAVFSKNGTTITLIDVLVSDLSSDNFDFF